MLRLLVFNIQWWSNDHCSLGLLKLEPQFYLLLVLLATLVVPDHSLSGFQCYHWYCTNVLHHVLSCETKPSRPINNVCFQDAAEHYTAPLAPLPVPATQRLTTTTLTASGSLQRPRDGLSQWTLISSASMTQGTAAATIWSSTMGQMPAIPPPGPTAEWYVSPSLCDLGSG